MTTQTTRIEYDDSTVRYFMIASVFWGLVGMAVGVLIAAQLNFRFLNFDTSWLTFGRLRPLHTNAVIFAFVGNMMFAGIYYSTQRLCKVRTASDLLSKIHFWGWQLIILAAAITLPLGLSRGKEYAELIWPINIGVTLVWVVFAVNFFWTLVKRNEPTIYVAIWFYIATIVTVAMLYIVNHLSIPTSLTHSYPVFAGVQDALVQWWYGHNAVAFFLTTPILGIMYYFIPKAANRPVYSYRLSVIHFWSLVFIYIWAGPHHLLNTALPQWLEALGMIFSLMLWAPSWGGMLNGLLTLRGAWHLLRTDPVLKFLAAGVTFYGMATFEGPLLSIKAVNQLSHYSDWTIGHVHSGTLGWNGFMAAGMFYWLAPRLWNTKLHSVGMANLHFWIGLVGILFYVGSMWVSGITQGLMLNGTIENGTQLANPNFVETTNAIHPLMLMRLFGGVLYIVGWGLMIYNLARTVMGGQASNGVADVVVEKVDDEDRLFVRGTFINAPVALIGSGIVLTCLWMFGGGLWFLIGMFGAVALILVTLSHARLHLSSWTQWHEKLLANAIPFSILTFVAVAIGGIVQIVPLLTVDRIINNEEVVQRPYTPLELTGRHIYQREGCYNCHSQMVRTLVPDVLRYGDYSRLGESALDRPFQWGSRRAGPDLAREGGKRSDVWHYQHMRNPDDLSPGSIMPNYPWLLEDKADIDALPNQIAVLRGLGDPYPERTPEEIEKAYFAEAKEIAQRLREAGEFAEEDSEIVALIAYLQCLGQNTVPAENINAIASN